ncbi:hypothetical protein niasHT_004026 [Heterodera trifolii]|uniref:ABC transmembrane type-1 domain-containing protein n=1 Tax=Heterodera trifolii TaxID=157864 RepID=A0ABD2LT90_9BILA
MVAIALSLMLRTYADVWMIQTSIKIEAAIISRHKPRFWRSLTGYLLCMPPVSVINSFLELSLCELKLRFCERLTHHFYAQYLDGFTYKVNNLDNRIANADQLLTQDVDHICEGIVELYSNLSKQGTVLFDTLAGAAMRRRMNSHFFTLLPPIFGTVSSRPNLQLSIIRESIEIRRLIVPHSLRDRNVHSSMSKAKQLNERDESVRACSGVLTFWTTTNDVPN